MSTKIVAKFSSRNRPFKKRHFVHLFWSSEDQVDSDSEERRNGNDSTFFRLRSYPTVWNLTAEVDMALLGQLECGSEHKKMSIRPLSPAQWCTLRRWTGYIDLFHVCNPHLPHHPDVTGLRKPSYPSAESYSESFRISICNHDDTQTFTAESTPTCPKQSSKRFSKRPQSQNLSIPLHSIINNPNYPCSTNSSQNQCQVCCKSYSTTWEFKLHLNTHTLPFDCPLCSKRFSRPWLLRGHLRTHTGEKPFKCHQCGKAFADKSNLRAHEQTHAIMKKHVCSSCFLSFSRASVLQKHKINCPHVQTGRMEEGRKD